jgi:lipid-binding SYLF domain-containing protein
MQRHVRVFSSSSPSLSSSPRYLLGIQLTELLKVLQRDIITRDMKHNILKSTTMTIGKNKSIAVDELGVLGVVSHELVE